MTTRSTSRSVIFRGPFILDGFDAVQAAGTYVIETEEEAIENISFLAYRRVSTQMQICRLGKTEYRFIDPADLDEALIRDAASREEQNGPGSFMTETWKDEKADGVYARPAVQC